MITTPCRRNPASWDLNPDQRDTWVDQALAAVQQCETCPGQRACGLLALDQPPQHDCVIGAWVSYQGRLMRFAEFATKMATPLPTVTCALQGCDQQFVPKSKEHRYCSKGHRDRVKNTAAGAVATIPQPRVCALEGCRASFMPRRARHWFCTPSCQQESRRRREEAKREARAKRRERNETAVRLVEAGHSLRATATQLGVPYTTVYRAVNGGRAAAVTAA